MKILICPDKFKGSLTAREVCDAIEQAILEIHPQAGVHSVPLADGGEGTCALLTEWHQGHEVELPVHGPLLDRVTARYGISGDGQAAFIEMAEASGLMLLQPRERNPLFTTTLGTGELIVDALDRGVQRVILGIGGSATNDAGIGMASALGYDFYDSSGAILKPVGESLSRLHSLAWHRLHPRLKKVQVTALCDVTNPLFGPDGAAHVYGPQKGADSQAVEALDAGLRNFARIVGEALNLAVDFPGAGAAGGLGAGARAFLDASIERGIDYLIADSRLAEEVAQADIIITGEGKIDRQTFSGKVVSEVLRLAKRAGKSVYAVCGVCEIPEEEIRQRGIEKMISLVDSHTTPESAIRDARRHIQLKVLSAFKHVAIR